MYCAVKCMCSEVQKESRTTTIQQVWAAYQVRPRGGRIRFLTACLPAHEDGGHVHTPMAVREEYMDTSRHGD
ncbi:hypothetical protein Pmani_018246 [Petrolisthes manimaculis]|uniref:Uncharacterized protein n=1 Tax=Petrolisthes manimaculis TaxID=1843537 RepID=A0AAE1PK60_9EUCA|nr:hypothetical protein Pmani_018246 [Petrolisthes manimaculis]